MFHVRHRYVCLLMDIFHRRGVAANQEEFMGLKIKNRYWAFGLHFLLSVPFVLVVMYLVLGWWQPEPYLTADGGWTILAVLLTVFIVIGPVLTFLMYKPGKWGLRFDLVVIALLQVSSLCYGAYVFYTERPIFLVFAVDRFTLISMGDFERNDLKQAQWLDGAARGPLKVYAKMPENAQQRDALLKQVMAGKPDLEFRAEYYEAFDPNLNKVLKRSYDIATAARVPATEQRKITAFNKEHCPRVEQCAYFPLIGKKRDMLLVLNREDGSVIGAIDVNPWSA